ncbi:MAG: twin-arginine translocase TatA/TatE family subunit [Alphaproteobacteria bacterium]
MLDIAWPELVVIGAVALVAIGPKDLPKAMHTLGKWAAKARALAHDVHRTIEQISYEAEVAEKLRKNEPATPAPPPAPEPPQDKHD